MKNIDDFNMNVATYISKLYRSFPKPDHITPEDVGLNMHVWNDEFEAAVAAAHWLLREGYISGEKMAAGVILQRSHRARGRYSRSHRAWTGRRHGARS